MNEFIQNLRRVMEDRAIDAKKLSGLTYKKIPISKIRSLLNGKSTPSQNDLRIIAEGLRVDAEDLQPRVSAPNTPVTGFNPVKTFENTPLNKKPGKIKKAVKITNSVSRIHKIERPDILVCSNCDQEDETCVYCHPEDDVVKFIYGGRGVSVKVPDELCALLCYKCRTLLDEKPDKDAPEIVKMKHSLSWCVPVIKTQAIRLTNKLKNS